MILTVSDLRFGYNGQPVLRDVRFSLAAGEMIAVLGVNGAGKSTLLKCLTGILVPQAGKVFLNETDLRRLTRRELARMIGYVPQRFAGEGRLTVFDAVLLGRRPHVMWSSGEKDYQVTEEVLRTLELERLALRPLSTLSGGELQRVMIGRALAQEPQVLILDEPTSNLDVKSQVTVMALASGAARDRGMALVVAMHDLGMALRFADRFILLKEGKVVSILPRDTVTAEAIEAVFDVKVVLTRVDGIPVVVPLTC